VCNLIASIPTSSVNSVRIGEFVAVALIAVLAVPQVLYGDSPPGVPTIDGLDLLENPPQVSADWRPQLITNPSITAEFRRSNRTCSGVRLSRMIDLAKSRNDLVSTGYCLAEPGVSYIVFAPEGGKISLDLSAASGEFTAEWIDPVAGTRSPAGPVGGGARHSFSASSDAAAVLFLKRSSQP
jgi:hypothetical protein